MSEPYVQADQAESVNALFEQFRDYFGCSVDLFANSERIDVEDPIGDGRGSRVSPSMHGQKLDAQTSSQLSFSSLLETIQNIRLERYTESNSATTFFQSGYYSLRPTLPRFVRQLIHRNVFRSRQKSSFPMWPIDCSVEHLFRTVMRALLRVTGETQIPFIWFWPEGHPAALMMTHDVEGELGARRCGMVMDANDSFGIPAAFQLVPEGPYAPIGDLVDQIRSRGYEANLHDLHHDGRLYDSAELFSKRAKQIRQYARAFKTKGFRAGSMHRRQDWIPQLGIEYDMSVPNAAHLEPQTGGCCTVMPYFIKDVLELPLTTTQDYALFFILRETSIDLWKRQFLTITNAHGLMTFVVHPDYLAAEREQMKYLQLLEFLASAADDNGTWVTCPGEINTWWRQRRDMQLVRTGTEWTITGEGCDKARVAFATLLDDELVYNVPLRQSQPSILEY